MVKTQVQIPDLLYAEAKRIAIEREMSFAEVVRRGIEHVAAIYPKLPQDAPAWKPPSPVRLGKFLAPEKDWREIANR